MALKTDFKDEILQEGKLYREYDLLSKDGTMIQTDVHLVRKDIPQQVGDKYGALEINELNNEVNGKLPNTYKPTWDSVSDKPATYPSSWGQVSDKPATYPSSWGQVSDKPTNLVTGTGVLKIQKLTQAQYNSSPKSSDTEYIIVG